MPQLHFIIMGLFVFVATSLSAADATYENIHGKGLCDKCHKDSQPTHTSVGLRAPSETLCSECHLTHSLNHTRVPQNVSVAAGWPVEPNKNLGCATCHEESECRKRKGIPAVVLRQGPYSQLGAFCSECHHEVKEQLSHFKPHLLEEKSPSSCFYCHNVDTTKIKPTVEEPHLKKRPQDLCLECHSPHVHMIADEHVGHMLEKEQMQRLAEINVRIPLSSDYKIICTTCHLPHTHDAQAVRNKDSGLLFGMKKIFEGVSPQKPSNTSRVRLSWMELCTACHQMDKKVK